MIVVDKKPHNVQTPMYRVTYMLQVSKLDDTFLEAINKQQDITLMNTRFQPHIVPGMEASRATMTVTNDTRQHLHVLMMHLAALGYSGIDSEAALLGLLRRTENEHEVLDDAGRAPVAAIEGVGEDEARFEDDTGAEAEADEDDGPRPMRTLEEHVGQ